MAVKPTHDFSTVGLVLPAPASTSNPGSDQRGATWVGSDGNLYYYDGSVARSVVGVSQLRVRPQAWTDCIGTGAGNIAPYSLNGVSSGTAATQTSDANHPGVIRFTSFTNADSGDRLVTGTNNILLAAGDYFEAVISIVTLTNLTIRIGFIDTINVSDCVDGAYFEIVSTGVATAKTSDNSTRTSAGTTATLSITTWYRLEVEIVSSTSARFRIYNADTGAVVLAEQNITTNIPTGSTRQTGIGIIATNSGTTATALVDVDWLGYERRISALVR